MAGETFLTRIKVFLDGAGKASSDAKNLSKGMDNLAKSALKAGAAYFTAQGVLNGVSKSIELFRQQEEAENKLRVAMGGTSKALLDQASALQKSSRFGDEAVISQQAFLAGLGFSEEQIMKMIPTILDMSEALGMDLTSATRNVAKTFSGLQGELGELVTPLRDLTAEQLKNGAALDVLNRLYGGDAQAALDTYGGRLDSLGNRFSDIGEAFGSLLLPAITTVANVMVTLAEHFDAGKMKSYAVTVGSAALAYGIMSGAIKKAAIAMIDFTKASRKNLIILAATIAAAELLDLFDLLGDGLEELEEDVKNLNTSFGNTGSLAKMNQVEVNALKTATRELGLVQNDVHEKEVAHQLIQQEILNLKSLQTQGLIDENEAKVKSAQLNIQLHKSEKALLELERQRSQMKMKVASDSVKALALVAQAGGKHRKDIANAQMIASTIDAFAAAQASRAQVAALLPPPAPGIAYAASLATGLANAKMTRDAAVKMAATGMDEIVTEPTLIMAGEAGAEYVNIEPTTNEGEGMGGGTVIFQGNVLSRDFIEDEAIPLIQDALRKGGDIGIG